jgi:hypothetical protein
MTRLEEITHAYWTTAINARHPEYQGDMRVWQALELLNKRHYLRPTEHRLHSLMNTLTLDIVEGNSEWRLAKQEVHGSISILPTKE